MTYNIWNKWDTLRTVMLGECYSPEFFKDIKNPRIKSALQRIASETQEDLENYERVLKDFGCNIIRPDIDKNDSIMNYTDHNGTLTSIPRSPLQPRDCQLVIGDKLFYTGYDHPGIANTLTQYNKNYYYIPTPMLETSFTGYKGAGAPDWPDTFDDYQRCFIEGNPYSENLVVHEEIVNLHTTSQHKIFNNGFNNFPIEAPCITVVGKDIYIDLKSENNAPLSLFMQEWFIEQLKIKFPDFRFNFLTIGGHNDGCFHTIKPGAILSIKEIQTFNDTFPGWDVCYLPDQSWDKVKGFEELKKKNAGKWWVPGEEDNDEFTHFVETWLNDWVGYVEETVFDVNVLVLDEHHVCVSQPDNKQVNSFLKKHNIEPVYIPWRHRYFWDGGLHCITLDLVRDGAQQDYFPQRTTSITDKGFTK